MWTELIQPKIQVEMIDSNTWVISEGVGRGMTHNYVLEGTQYALVIDTGLNVFNLSEIVSTLTSKPLLLLNTHGHIDHITNNSQFNEVYLHPADHDLYLEHSQASVRKQFFIERLLSRGYPQWLLNLPFIEAYLTKQSQIKVNKQFKPLSEGQIIDLGGRPIEIIETPGHTWGSVCLLDRNQQALYVGDSVCEDAVLLQFDHSTPVSVYVESLEKLLNYRQSLNSIYAGHQKKPLGIEWLEAYYQCGKNCLKDIAQHTLENQNKEAALRTTFGQATLIYKVDQNEKRSK